MRFVAYARLIILETLARHVVDRIADRIVMRTREPDPGAGDQQLCTNNFLP
jgi:hypothetical protein